MRVYLTDHIDDIRKVWVDPHPVTRRKRHVGYASPRGWSFIQPSGGVRDLTPREKRLVEVELKRMNLGFANGLVEQG